MTDFNFLVPIPEMEGSQSASVGLDLYEGSYNTGEPQLQGSMSAGQGGGGGQSGVVGPTTTTPATTSVIPPAMIPTTTPASYQPGAEFDTLDEPIKVTIMRDLGAVASKFYHVLYPK